jgi:hypothetical protein
MPGAGAIHRITTSRARQLAASPLSSAVASEMGHLGTSATEALLAICQNSGMLKPQ